MECCGMSMNSGCNRNDRLPNQERQREKAFDFGQTKKPSEILSWLSDLLNVMKNFSFRHNNKTKTDKIDSFAEIIFTNKTKLTNNQIINFLRLQKSGLFIEYIYLKKGPFSNLSSASSGT